MRTLIGGTVPSRRPEGRAGGEEVAGLAFLDSRVLAEGRGEETRAGGVPEAFCAAWSTTGAGGEGRGAGPPETPLMDGLFSAREKQSTSQRNIRLLKIQFSINWLRYDLENLGV